MTAPIKKAVKPSVSAEKVPFQRVSCTSCGTGAEITEKSGAALCKKCGNHLPPFKKS